MGITDQDGVVAANERSVQRGPDAGVGLRTGEHHTTDAAGGQLGLERGVFERVAVPLVHHRLDLVALQFEHVLPALGVLDEAVVGVLHPDHRHALGTRSVDERTDVGDDLVAQMRIGHHVVLNIDHHEGGVGTVFQSGHGYLLIRCAVPIDHPGETWSIFGARHQR